MPRFDHKKWLKSFALNIYTNSPRFKPWAVVVLVKNRFNGLVIKGRLWKKNLRGASYKLALVWKMQTNHMNLINEGKVMSLVLR